MSTKDVLYQLHYSSRLNPLATQYVCLQAAKLIRELQERINELEKHAAQPSKKAKAPAS